MDKHAIQTVCFGEKVELRKHESETELYSRLKEEHGFGWVHAEICPAESPRVVIKARSVRDWDRKFSMLIDTYIAESVPKWQEAVRLEALQKDIADLKGRCELLERLSPILVPIETFAPEPYEVIKPFHVVVRFQDSEYIASFFDANLSASGDTQMEAIVNLKDIITATFDILTNENEKKLGSGPLQQKKVLGEFICAKG